MSHTDRILMLGSCFTDNIGEKLHQRLFTVLRNPFGPLYNPASIRNAVEQMVNNVPFSERTLHQNADSQWFSYSCHSKLNGSDASTTLRNLNARLERAHRFVQQATATCITLGTAWVFTLNSTGLVVANCQKQHPSLFTRRMLSLHECTRELKHTVALLRSINPEIKIILTVSPIRHLADGAHGNQLSKSTLLLSCNEVTTDIDNIVYFPSYEIMMDDLRDYRFYASDMKHPSDVAVDYIYELFSQSFFTNDTVELSREAFNLTRRFNHIPISSTPETVDNFRASTLNLLNSLVLNHPELKHHELFNQFNSRNS